MSYPRKIHTLIVEDETVVIASYHEIFNSLKGEFDLLKPDVVLTYEDAQHVLEQGRISH